MAQVIVDTTFMPKNVMFPTDAKFMNRAREKLVRLAKQHGLELRQSYTRVGKYAMINTNFTPTPNSSNGRAR